MGLSHATEGTQDDIIVLGKESYIHSVDTNYVDPIVIAQVHEIEQDLWARFLGEYLKCTSCGLIHSKDDVFGLLDLSKKGVDIRKNTVTEIEKALEMKSYNCHECNGKTEAIFGKDYRDEIASRHDFDRSFLLLHRSINGRLLGYVDAYISDFDTIYEREFECYYTKGGKENIRRKIKDILCSNIPDEMLCLSGVGNTPDSATMKNLYNLEKGMVEKIIQDHPNIMGIYEGVIGSCAHMILDICNAKRLNMEPENDFSTNANVRSDIFLHQNMAVEGVKGLGKTFKSFFKKHKKRIHELRN